MRFLSVSLLCLPLFIATPAATAQSTTSAAASSASAPGAVADSTAPSVADDEAFDEEPWDRAGSYVDDHAHDYVGADEGWTRPYERESAIYRTAPPLRYNRVEGIVLGLRRGPLSLRDPNDAARIYGQVEYAFAQTELRYTIGVESNVVRDAKTGLKLGVSYQKQTLTPDRWKTSYLENSLGGIGLRYDFFDYYEAEGLSLYAVQGLSRTVRLTAGFRAEEHRPLRSNTNWSLFDAGTFRPNPQAEAGRLHAGFVSLEGGRIRNYDDLPTGAAFRAAATIGTAFGGDLDVNRYEVDGRAFLPLSPTTRLGLRLRGGYATSEAPRQTQFTLGGIGSVRSYDQNARRGTRMLLGNVEYIIDGATLDSDFLDDLFLVGLFDAGWVGQPDQRFRVDDVLPSAGFGIGLDERQIRLDVAWPLRDVPATGSSPSIWLRITPNF
jgi:hypothetical protein